MGSDAHEDGQKFSRARDEGVDGRPPPQVKRLHLSARSRLDIDLFDR